MQSSLCRLSTTSCWKHPVRTFIIPERLFWLISIFVYVKGVYQGHWKKTHGSTSSTSSSLLHCTQQVSLLTWMLIVIATWSTSLAGSTLGWLTEASEGPSRQNVVCLCPHHPWDFYAIDVQNFRWSFAHNSLSGLLGGVAELYFTMISVLAFLTLCIYFTNEFWTIWLVFIEICVNMMWAETSHVCDICFLSLSKPTPSPCELVKGGWKYCHVV
jgi:hypothetical protein